MHNGLVDTRFLKSFEEGSINIYPVPADNLLNIRLNSADHLEYKISNTHGVLINGGEIRSNHTQIDISYLNDGMYLFEIEAGGEISRF